jgi:hypothetical protein
MFLECKVADLPIPVIAVTVVMVLANCDHFSAVAAGVRGEGCWYTCRYNIIYACKKNVVFPVPSFMKL